MQEGMAVPNEENRHQFRAHWQSGQNDEIKERKLCMLCVPACDVCVHTNAGLCAFIVTRIASMESGVCLHSAERHSSDAKSAVLYINWISTFMSDVRNAISIFRRCENQLVGETEGCNV